MERFNVVVLSGKGGAGKSMFSTSLAIHLSNNYNILAIDADVDAPDMAVWFGVDDFTVAREIYSTKRARILSDSPPKKPKAIDACPHKAISFVNGKIIYKRYLCEGCGLCSILNPDIFKMESVKNGEIRLYKMEYNFDLVEGHMLPGFTGSGKVVDDLFNFTKGIEYDIGIVDGSPGTGCPVNAALRHANAVILIVEESLSGMSDFEAVVSVVEHFNLPFSIIINKHGLNPSVYDAISESFGNRVISTIPYSKDVAMCAVERKPLVLCNGNLINHSLNRASEFISTLI